MTGSDSVRRARLGRGSRLAAATTLLAGAALATTAATVTPVGAAPLAALTDITTVGFDTVTIDTAACNPDGSGSFTFTATSGATGSFPGTLTETGTVVFGPAQTEPSYTPVLSYVSTFEIVGPNGTVTGGTQLLEPTTGFFGSQSLNQGTCITGGNREVNVETTYTATITLPDGTEVADHGVGRVFAGVDRFVSPSNVTTLDLESTAVYPAPDPGTVTVRATGVVEYVDDVAVSIGDPYVLEYTFEQSTSASYRTRTFATFPAISSMTLDIGGTTVSSPTGTIAVSNRSDEYRVDAYQTLTETGGPLGPAVPEQVFLQMGGGEFISELGIPLDPTTLTPQTRYAAISYGDPSCQSPFPGGCPRGSVQMTIDSLTIVQNGPDSDGDGVADDIAALDGGGTPIAGSFDDRSGTIGSIISGGGLLVEDAPAPDGVRVTTSEAVTIRMCGAFTVHLAPGSDVVLTCGSVTVRVTTGQATVDLGSTGRVVVGSGGTATVDLTGSGDYQVDNGGPTAVTVVRNGVATSLAGGARTFSVPQTRNDCMRGGWQSYGSFRNQGACVSFVSTRR